jgi:hypothetical protein
VSVTVYFDNHDNLYGYSPRSGELIKDRTHRTGASPRRLIRKVNEVIEVTGYQHE